MGCHHKTALEVRGSRPGFTTYSHLLFNKFSLNNPSDVLSIEDEKNGDRQGPYSDVDGPLVQPWCGEQQGRLFERDAGWNLEDVMNS